MKLHEPTKKHTAPRSILKNNNSHVYTTHLTPNGDKSIHSSISNFPKPSLSPTNSTSPTRSLSPKSSQSQINVSNRQFQSKVEQQNSCVTQPLVQKPTNLNTQNLPTNMENQRSPVQYSNHSSPQWPHSPQSQINISNKQFQYKIEQQNNFVTQPLVQKPTNLNTQNLPINMEYQRSPVQYSNNAAPQWPLSPHSRHQNSPSQHFKRQNSSDSSNSQGYSPEIPSTPTFRRQNSSDSSNTQGYSPEIPSTPTFRRQNSAESSNIQGYSPEIPSTPTFRRQNFIEPSNTQNCQGYLPEITLTPTSKRQDSSDYSSTQNSHGHTPRSVPEPQCQSKLMHRVKSLRSATSSPQNVGGLESMRKPTTIDDYVSQAIRYHENDQLEKSTEYFHIAAKQNNTIGMIFYGLALRHGWGCKTDTARAFKYLQKAAGSASEMLKNIDDKANSQILKTGLVLAIYELGMCYKHGWGVPKDKARAAYYYKIAADQGDPDAQNDIAHCYYKGEGVKKDMKTAAKYYRMADKQGYGTMGNSWIFKEKYND
ncbi:10561_t:CDS:2 [Cetraspora pellucida]|uniref:10561_t:CDS:1 n=1 Tax=Cetraspora pellucida TaxID=1433469 RepID=A0ACA9KUL0_9GLOM|nr:10561_t:CDS:2 [Cetraspora pellucida]